MGFLGKYFIYYIKQPDFWYAKAITFREKNNFKASIDYCTKLLERDSRNMDAFILRSECYFLNNQNKESFDDAKSAMSLNPANPYPYSTIAQVYSILQDEESEDFYYFMNEAIKRGFKLECYLLEKGITERKNEERFQDLLKFRKNYAKLQYGKCK